jgi:hypothetical protein
MPVRQTAPFPAFLIKIKEHSVIPQPLRTGIGLLLGRKGLRLSYGWEAKAPIAIKIDARASNLLIEKCKWRKSERGESPNVLAFSARFLDHFRRFVRY